MIVLVHLQVQQHLRVAELSELSTVNSIEKLPLDWATSNVVGVPRSACKQLSQG
jgi:hypothetical protein